MPHTMGRPTPPKPAAQPFSLYSHAIAPAAGSGAFERALLAALRLRRPQVLERLLEQAGANAFAQALQDLTARQMVDAVSLLPREQQTLVCAHLPPTVRRQWQPPVADGRHVAARHERRPLHWTWPWRAERGAPRKPAAPSALA